MKSKPRLYQKVLIDPKKLTKFLKDPSQSADFESAYKRTLEAMIGSEGVVIYVYPPGLFSSVKFENKTLRVKTSILTPYLEGQSSSLPTK